jgi:hypothetical protein
VKPIPVVLLLSPAGPAPAETWMGQARLAAARDLLARLQRVPAAGPLFVMAGHPDDQQDLVERGARPLQAEAGPFHFGRALAAIITRQGLTDLAYFGGASAPLASEAHLQEALDRARGEKRVVVNNYHSTDWAVVPEAEILVGLADRLRTDNALGWVLAHDGDRQVEPLPASAASRADLDTPADVAMIARHPGLGPEVGRVAESLPQPILNRLDQLLQILRTPGRTLSVIGRASSTVWQALEARRQVWIRMFAEERGMLASGRAERGEVRSLIGAMVDQAGPRAFLRSLGSMSDGAIWDTRVWMSQRGPWPSAADRFSADLGRAGDIEDGALRELTAAVEEASLPIVTGGHGVVAGGLLALLESLEP